MHNAVEEKKTEKKESDNTILLIKYLYFLGILVVITGMLVLFTLLSRNTWQRDLREQVVTILQKSRQGTYSVGESIDIKTAFSTSGIVYELKEKGNASKEYAVLLRVATVYGPLPALFIYTPGKDVQFVTFVTFVTFGGKAETQIENISRNSQIAYWIKRIPSIVQSGMSKASKGETKNEKK